MEFYSGDLRRLVDEVLAPRYGNIWLVGGGILCQSFLRLGLGDGIRLSIIPILLGDGLRLFANSSTEKRWHLEDVVTYSGPPLAPRLAPAEEQIALETAALP